MGPESAGTPVAPPAQTGSRRSRARRVLMAGLALAVVGFTFAFVLPKIANYGEVWDAIKDLSAAQIGVLAGATILNLVTFAPPWQAALPGLSFLHAFIVTQVSTASTYVLPGGGAVGVASSYAMLRTWGFRGPPIALAATVLGIWNQLLLLAFPAIGLALLTLQHERNALLSTVALVALVVLVLAIGTFAAGLSTNRLACWLGNLLARIVNWALRLLRRGPVRWNGDSLVALRAEALGLLGRRWHLLTLSTLAGQLTVFIVLLACLRTLGVSPDEVSVVEAFAAWSLVRLLGSLPITPGGIGVVEVGLTGALVGFGGNNAEVVAAVLVYRFLTIVPTLVLGLGGLLVARRLRPELAQGQA